MFTCLSCSATFEHYSPWCSACATEGLIVPEARRAFGQALGRFVVRQARELVRDSWSLEGCPSYPGLPWSPGAFVLLWGPPGSGKSTMGFRFAAEAGGPVGAYLVEEDQGPAVGQRLRACGLDRPDVHVLRGGGVEDLIAWARGMPRPVLVIDSVSATFFTPADLRRLVEVAGLRLLVVTCQATKQGAHAGPAALAHEADAAVHVEAGAWTVEKNRYGPAGASGRVGLVGEHLEPADEEDDQE
jgi:predicted ATP-dependent serine protease